MFAMRHSGARSPNPQVREAKPKRGEGNVAWLKRSEISQGVLLIGGAALTDLRLRVAQSRLRSDLTPSHWSVAALFNAGEATTVALDAIGDPGEFAARNGVTPVPLARYDDPAEFPNIAILLFSSTFAPVLDALDDVVSGRAVLDVPALTAAWLASIWGVEDLDAPLREGRGIPGAALVELCHAIAGIELTPGLESTSSCPDAIWQSARWWTDYYRESAAIALRAGARPDTGHAQPSVPAGAFAIRSRLAPPQPTSAKEVSIR
jgi:hypothetical protein